MIASENSRDGLHISVSQLRTYLRCPRSYQMRYVLGTRPAFKPVPFAFGTSFHAALARFYVAVKEDGAPPPLQLVVDAFRDAWQRELDADLPLQAEDDGQADTGALGDKGTEMLAVFHDHAVNNLDGAKVEAVEQPFSVSLIDPDTGVEMEEKLVGVLDLVLKKGRKPQVVEHKTSARNRRPRLGDDLVRDLHVAEPHGPRREPVPGRLDVVPELVLAVLQPTPVGPGAQGRHPLADVAGRGSRPRSGPASPYPLPGRRIWVTLQTLRSQGWGWGRNEEPGGVVTALVEQEFLWLGRRTPLVRGRDTLHPIPPFGGRFVAQVALAVGEHGENGRQNEPA